MLCLCSSRGTCAEIASAGIGLEGLLYSIVHYAIFGVIVCMQLLGTQAHLSLVT